VTMAAPASSSQSPAHTRKWPRALLALGRVALGVIFIYAAYSKLHFNGAWHVGDYRFFFGMVLDSYHVLPAWGVDWLGMVLPWFELVLGALLLSGVGLRWVGSVASVLLVIFIGAMLRAKLLGLEINCGCFGNNEKLGTLTLIRDSGLLFLALAVTIGAFLLRKRRTELPS